MADSKRQQIIDKIDARLKLILTTGGYLTNAGQHVYPWLSVVVPVSDEIVLAYRDHEETSEAATVGTSGYHRHNLSIEIKVLVAGAEITMDIMRQVFADIESAIGSDVTWDGLAERTLPGGNSVEISQEDKIIAGGVMNYTVTYLTKAWNPYL